MKLDWADDVQNSVIPVAPYILGDDTAFCSPGCSIAYGAGNSSPRSWMPNSIA